ncbi:CoA transferase [Rhodoferax ferrireducens]|uniref:CoA transferase n=1 Tax=Rhodoferax ferrireducens TaxID=192843 RepID=UPI00140FA9BE
MTVEFRNTHHNKQSMVFDLKVPAEAQAFLRLSANSHVAIGSASPRRCGLVGRGACSSA